MSSKPISFWIKLVLVCMAIAAAAEPSPAAASHLFLTPPLVLSNAPTAPPADTRMQNHEFDSMPDPTGQTFRIRLGTSGGA